MNPWEAAETMGWSIGYSIHYLHRTIWVYVNTHRIGGGWSGSVPIDWPEGAQPPLDDAARWAMERLFRTIGARALHQEGIG